MPLYEYKCETCHHQFEVQQKFSDPLIDKCVRCGKGVRKLISAPGIMFKGSGWYVTDYSNKLKDPSQAKEPESPAKEAKDKPSGESEKVTAKSESGASAETKAPAPVSSPSNSASSGSPSSSSSGSAT
ncbi:MAG: zinc ribbon domain-containing protein [Nitrospira sp.]|nr:zinc ribbon domain-containing protein [Nitrospira sp.]